MVLIKVEFCFVLQCVRQDPGGVWTRPGLGSRQHTRHTRRSQAQGHEVGPRIIQYSI